MSDKRWRVDKEVELLKVWESEGRFSTKVEEGRPVLVIDTPPPYMSGRPPHIGQFASYAQMDMIVRFYRMRGLLRRFPVLRGQERAARGGAGGEEVQREAPGSASGEVPRHVQECAGRVRGRVEKRVEEVGGSFRGSMEGGNRQRGV